jgi:electron transport complex protein RnfB
MTADGKGKLTRRKLFRRTAMAAGAVGVGAAAVAVVPHLRGDGKVWQIDPARCIQCGNCATYCVLRPSAVKCVHAHALCGYCDLCFGYFAPGIEPDVKVEKPGAEAQCCPTEAILRKWVEGPHYEYTIDEALCIGCGKCIKGCNNFGNGSLFLQVMHNRCLNCNECSIAKACPSDAFRRVPSDQPYLLKGKDAGA